MLPRDTYYAPLNVTEGSTSRCDQYGGRSYGGDPSAPWNYGDGGEDDEDVEQACPTPEEGRLARRLYSMLMRRSRKDA